MYKQIDVMSLHALDHLLGEIVDTPEKLDILVLLGGARDEAWTTNRIARAVGHPDLAVADALSSLAHAGIVTTTNDDGAGWWLDPDSGWLEVIARVGRVYQRDRAEVLRRMTSLAVQRLRSGNDPSHTIILGPLETS